MTRFSILLLIFATHFSAVAGPAEKRLHQQGWRLIWHDEFRGKKLSAKKWNVLTREQSKHGELQYYLPDEVYVENGCLHLRSRARDFGSQHFTSGRVDTSGKFATTYGRFEIRAKLPRGRGLWPAYWLYPQNRDFRMERLMADMAANGKESLIPEARPWYTEIDIMEFLGHTNVVYGTLHYHTFDGQKKSNSGNWRGNEDFTKGFHVYALEWVPGSISWFVDGYLIHSTKEGVPNTPHYLILNTAVGGKWPGNPDASTVFPQDHAIDYVRVYAKKHYFN
ncbi:MAG TPA: glycoside hydrolase family 16 protein [Verrucomicrobiae bacterium]|nr:glycoside hydrolase family 16 protein [Verrucomicrobiae bacterium]